MNTRSIRDRTGCWTPHKHMNTRCYEGWKREKVTLTITQFLSKSKENEFTREEKSRSKTFDTIFLWLFFLVTYRVVEVCNNCRRVCCKLRTYQCRWRFSIGVIVPRIISRYSPKWRSAHFCFCFSFEKFINTHEDTRLSGFLDRLHTIRHLWWRLL
jgi:hypothetical protein